MVTMGAKEVCGFLPHFVLMKVLAFLAPTFLINQIFPSRSHITAFLLMVVRHLTHIGSQRAVCVDDTGKVIGASG